MQIKEANIHNFGKLQNKTYRFESGINLIYGENEAGKTTLHIFLKSMLFGLEKQRGRAGSKDEYLKYEPWHAPAFYSGALRFEVAGKPFFLERNFYNKEKRDFLCNEEDGEELSVAYGDLEMLLGWVTRETYENTYEISQSGATTSGRMSEILSEYLSDAAGSGNAGTKVTQAVQSLEQKKKERQSELKRHKVQKEESKERLCLQKELLEKEWREQKEMLSQMGQTMHTVVSKKDEEREKKRSRGGWIFAFMGFCLAGNGVANFFWYRNPMFFWLITVMICIAGAGAVVCFRHFQRKENEQEKENEQAKEWKQQEKQMERFKERLEEKVHEKEVLLANLEEEILQISQPDAEELELMEDIEALEMAGEQIKKAAEEMCEDIKDELDAEISKQVSRITAGKYDRIRVGEKGNLEIFAEGRKIKIEQLSRGTYEQLYLALRLAVGKLVTREEPLPILLDEVFAMYDEKRLQFALQTLAETGRQVFLFTCHKREEELLQQMGIPYHKVE